MPTNPAKNASQLRSNCCAYMITQITVTLQLVQGYRGMWTAQKQDGSPARQQCYEKCLKTHLFHNVFPSQTDCTQPSSMTSWILTSFQIFALILYSFVTFSMVSCVILSWPLVSFWMRVINLYIIKYCIIWSVQLVLILLWQQWPQSHH